MKPALLRAAVATACTSIFSLAYAGSPSMGCDCEVSIPKYAGGLSVSVEALYYAADVKDTTYAFSFQSQSGVDTFRSHNVDADNDWGYAIGLDYAAAGTGNDFRVTWTDLAFHGSETMAIAGNSNGELHAYVPLAPSMFAAADQPAVESYDVKGSYDVDHHKLDVEMAQAIRIGHNSVDLRFHAGLRYAEIDTKFKVIYSPLDNLNWSELSASFVAESDYDGLGPRMGVDGTWHLTKHFSLIANLSGSVLVGDAHAKQANISEGLGAVALLGGMWSEEGNQAHRVSYDHRVVPVLDARLGASYEHAFRNNASLTLQSGYNVSNYFDVDTKFDHSGTDIGYAGWYFQATLMV